MGFSDTAESLVTSDQLSKRRDVMRRSMALGHCVCDVRQPCPCEMFKTRGYCHCAGERPPGSSNGNGDAIRLTQHVRSAGCASKISKGVLKEVLAGLPEIDDPRVIVGASAGDDAGVMMLSPDNATILTVDVFSPAVDDAYTFGQIAAANSLSDIYAMGGSAQVALSIIGFPIDTLPADVMRQILLGGVEKMKEAGVCVIGGHSINDAEIKCGFAVVGSSPKHAFIRNAGAQVGDAIVLTKPLGSGIVAFAHQIGRASAHAMDAAARSMTMLNSAAGELMVKYSARAATDVTGFSLLGHLAEIVRNSGVQVTLDFDRIPLLPETMELAQAEVWPGAIERNRESIDAAMLDLSALSPAQQAILFGPETSGGLLVFLRSEKTDAYVAEARRSDADGARVIGRVTAQCAGGRIVVTTREEMTRVEKTATSEAASETPSCCAESPQAVSDDVLPAPAGTDAFKKYMAAVNAPAALDAREKKLIALALSVMSKCEPCVTLNARAARDAGATDAQIAEAAALGIAFGGAPVAMFYNTLRAKTIAETGKKTQDRG